MSVPLYVTVAEMRQTMSVYEVAMALKVSQDRVHKIANYARSKGCLIPDARAGGGTRDPEKLAEMGRLGAAKRARLAAVRDEDEADVPRERCTCSLVIDKDHTPENCDLRAGAARFAERRRSHWSDTVGDTAQWET